MSSIITFAANNDLFRKRKRVYRACETCKKRRKRCTHTFDSSETQSNSEPKEPERSLAVKSSKDGQDGDRIHSSPSRSQSANEISSSRPSNEPSDEAMNPPAEPVAQSRSASPSRFIGHMQPEAILGEQDQGTRLKQHECGYWMLKPRKDKQSSQITSDEAEQDAINKYLFIIDVSILPSKEHLDALLEIYFSYIHPLLPIVDQERPGRRKDRDLLSPMLLQAICIVASRHETARPHLVIYGSTRTEPRDFAKRFYKSIIAALNARLERDRIVLIQVFALLSLYVEGADGAEQASMHLSQAIHHAHTIGMQFGRARADDRGEYLQRLFWCLWSLDKLNAIMHGRPLLMNERDNRLDSPLASPEIKHTAFGIWLQIASALDQVINFYRPNNDPQCTGWEDGFPGFEDMIGDGGETLSPSLLATLELSYHAVAMCSHRTRPITEPLPSSPSYVRQTLSTVRVIRILHEEFPTDLSPFPVVPWALSLAMANTYRQFRQSKLPMLRNRAKSDLQSCCGLLEKMKVVWWSAGAMSELGRAALKKASKRSAGAPAAKLRPQSQTPTMNGSQDYQTDGPSVNNVLGGQNGTASPETSNNLPVNPSVEEDETITESTPNLSFGSANDAASPFGIDANVSPDWLNFDTAFEHFETVLGSSGADLSMELLRPFNFEEFGSQGLSG